MCRVSNSAQVTCVKSAFQLENAKLSSDQNDKAAGAAREELKEARVRIEALTYQLSGLQKQVKQQNVLFISNTEHCLALMD